MKKLNTFENLVAGLAILSLNAGPSVAGNQVLKTRAEHSVTAFQAKQPIEAIERNKNNTFSITCSFHFPHAPMLPVKPYADMYPFSEMKVPDCNMVHDMFGQNIYSNYESFTGQESFVLPLTNGICLIKPIGNKTFPAHKITIQN